MLSADVAAWVHSLAGAAQDARTWAGLSFHADAVVLRLALVSWWMLAAIVAALFAPRAVARGTEKLGERPGASVLAGLLFHASFVLAALLAAGMTRSLVGLPLLGLVVLAGTLVRATGLAAAFTALGGRLMARSGGRSSAYAQLMLGALTAGVFAFVPVAGAIAWLLLASAGAGGVLGTWRRGAPTVRMRP